MRLSRTSVSLLAIICFATACNGERGDSASLPSGTTGGESATPDAAAIRVVATTTIFADIVKAVGGTRVSAISIVPSGVGPEDYEPKPDDARNLAGAGLIVSNGVGLDDFLDRLLGSTGSSSATRLILGEGIPTIDVDGEPNPHFWLDPTIVKTRYLPKIVDALAAIDPSGSATFESNALAYGAKLDALDAELRGQVETIPTANRKLVTFHDAFPYFARHFGFEIVGVVVANVGQEPTPAELAALVAKVRATGTRAVFSESQFNPKLSQSLADEAGIREVVMTLYNDALGPPPADSYLGMMRWNVRQIVDALR